MKIGIQHVLTWADCSLIKEFLNPKHKIGLGAKRLVSQNNQLKLWFCSTKGLRYQEPGTRKQRREGGREGSSSSKACSALLSVSSPKHACTSHSCSCREREHRSWSQSAVVPIPAIVLASWWSRLHTLPLATLVSSSEKWGCCKD